MELAYCLWICSFQAPVVLRSLRGLVNGFPGGLFGGLNWLVYSIFVNKFDLCFRKIILDLECFGRFSLAFVGCICPHGFAQVLVLGCLVGPEWRGWRAFERRNLCLGVLSQKGGVLAHRLVLFVIFGCFRHYKHFTPYATITVTTHFTNSHYYSSPTWVYSSASTHIIYSMLYSSAISIFHFV